MGNAFGILASRFRILVGTMDQMLKVVSDNVLTCVAHHTEDTQRQTRPSPADDKAAIANEVPVYVPDKTTRILQGRQNIREAY